jgi:low temperature requirement protein LtrA
MNLFLYNLIFRILVYISKNIRTNLEDKKYRNIYFLCYVTNAFSQSFFYFWIINS